MTQRARRHRLLIATGNRHKIDEFRQIIDTERWELVAPDELGLGDFSVIEDGETYHQNAAKKARAYANASGLPALADDSGLEVDALDGKPGIHSARYAGIDSTGTASSAASPGITSQDIANRRKLLDALRDVPRDQRGARFRAVVAIAFPYGPNLRYGEGTIEGRIAEDERGESGFGYDPIFELPDGRRLAELSRDEKNAISHRGRAARDAQWALDALATALNNAD
jgi:XTP/dITP diphosphohydrolase